MLKVPPLLQIGDRVGIVSPAKNVDVEQLKLGAQQLGDWGLTVVLGEFAFSQFHQFAGTDGERLADLQRMINDPSIRAVFCSRGGYGTTRILDSLDLSSLLQNPKWIIGFSDITALLSRLHGLGLEGLHAIMPMYFPRTEYSDSVSKLRNLLFHGHANLESKEVKQIVPGIVEAPVVGGNLSLLVNSIGTISELETNRKILFLEDVDEYVFRLDRMIVQLKRAGKLDGLAGLILGHFTDIKDSEIPFGQTIPELVLEHTKHLEIPIGLGFPIGHEPPNYPIRYGRRARLQVELNRATLVFK